MTLDGEWTKEQVLDALANKCSQLSDIEREWKKLREQERALCMALITQHGVSTARVAQLSGHHRQTLKIWLTIWNAENKGKGTA